MLKARITREYKNPADLLDDRRLKDAEHLELLEAWPPRDDYDRGLVAATRVILKARISEKAKRSLEARAVRS